MTVPFSVAANEFLASRGSNQDKLVKATGHFTIDYLQQCHALGVWPHPAIIKAAKLEQLIQWPATAIDQDVTDVNNESSPLPAHSILPPFQLSLHVQHGQQVDALIGMLPNVQILDLRHWQLDSGTIQALSFALASSKTIHTIRMFSVSLELQHIAALIKSIQTANAVASFSFDYSIIKDAHLAPVQSWVSAFAELVTDQSVLKMISLRGNHLPDPVGAEIFNRLKSNKTLQVINLAENELANETALAISQCLRRNRSLVSLTLQKNMISDSGLQAIFVHLKQFLLEPEEVKNKKDYGNTVQQGKQTFCTGNNTVRHLNVSHNSVTDAMLDEIMDTMQQVESLAHVAVDGNHFTTEVLTQYESKHLELFQTRLQAFSMFASRTTHALPVSEEVSASIADGLPVAHQSDAALSVQPVLHVTPLHQFSSLTEGVPLPVINKPSIAAAVSASIPPSVAASRAPSRGH